MAPFDLRSAGDVLRIDGTLVGLADLRPRTHLDDEIHIVAHPGDAVTVLDVVTQRDGVPGIYGDVRIVQAPLKKWLERAERPFVSMPLP